jgi:hypothetical protein
MLSNGVAGDTIEEVRREQASLTGRRYYFIIDGTIGEFFLLNEIEKG